MPQYQGESTTWEPWELDTAIYCRRNGKVEGCSECGKHGQSIAHARTVPRSAHHVGFLVVLAFRCEHCAHVHFIDARDADHPVSVMLCDQCDAIAAVGHDDDEARASLVATGGWTGGPGADWDICSACNHDGVLRALPRPARR